MPTSSWSWDDNWMSSWQTWDVDPTLFYCWANVVDGGPTVNQRWANVSCLLGYCPPDTRRSPDVCLMSAHRTWRWSNINQKFGSMSLTAAACWLQFNSIKMTSLAPSSSKLRDLKISTSVRHRSIRSTLDLTDLCSFYHHLMGAVIRTSELFNYVHIGLDIETAIIILENKYYRFGCPRSIFFT